MNLINALNKLFSFDIANPISFNSGAFLLFFTTFIVIYAFFYRNKIIRNILLVAFSLFIYYKLTGWYLLIMILTLILDYFLALFIYKSKDKKKKIIYAVVSVCTSLGLLIYFKYTNFFIESFSNISGGKFTLLNIIIPLGISFYTFRTISYIIDVYREDMKPTFNILDYAVYMTFFPLLISGPISRAKNFLPQVKKRFSIKDDKINRAIFLIIIGLIKKAVIADYIGQYCNLIFDAPGTYSGFENLVAVYGFALQIYFDFSGYTDMAIGLAKLLGFDIGTNFNKPYNALNVTEFWRRWHMTLSSWLRDYLFSPLTLRFRNWGNAGIVLSLFITFVLCGFWHGANWTFIVWGALFGAMMAIEILVAKQRKKIKKRINKRIYNFVSWFLTFNFVTFLWIFFRSKDMDTAGQMFYQIFNQMDWAYLPPFLNVRSLLVVFIIVGFLFSAIPSKWFPPIAERFISMPLWAKAIVFLAAVQLVIQFQSADVQPFLYAQF